MHKTMIHYEGNVFPFWCANQTHLFRHVAKYRTFYEYPMLEYIQNLCVDDPDRWVEIVDIGANCGNHTLFFAQFADEVHAFEPQQDVFACLERNLKGYNNAYLHNIALSDRIGFGSMRYPHGKESDHMAELEEFGGNIFINTLDSVVKELNIMPDIIKIDVEGHELQVLQGGKGIIRAYQPELFVECRDTEAYEQIYHYLGEHFGYVAVRSFGADLNFTPVWHFTCED